MYVKLNARNQIVEATDVEQTGGDYITVKGTVKKNMPDGLLGFNGRVNTPNYVLENNTVTARTDEDKARDPYSDEPQAVTEDKTAAQITDLQKAVAALYEATLGV